jgi:transcriptional regulator with PAS, ATPase and Fis domain
MITSILCKADTFQERETVKRALKRDSALNLIIGKSRETRRLHENIIRTATCDANVLIYGESGTGKELTARAIHYLSHRAGKPFVPVNCGAIPENLFENELFGHVKGAFTDAIVNQEGLIKEAEGGTLLLDEIGTISRYSQVKLLRFLQEREYKPLGSSKNRKADVRVIAATNKDLLTCVMKGTFRSDLFYRLNIVCTHVPPLRDRKDDIPLLTEHFIDKYTEKFNRPRVQLSYTDMECLESYAWPGNIRELENIIQRVIVASTFSNIEIKNILSELRVESTSEFYSEPEPETFNAAKTKVINTFEISYLKQLLEEEKGNVVKAAKKAGKNRTCFWNLLKKHDISPRQFQ